MRRVGATVVAAFVVVSLGTASALAQQDGAPYVTAVTGRIVAETADNSEEQWSEEGGVGHGRGFRTITQVEWSDPRIPPDGVTVQNFDMYQIGQRRGLPWQGSVRYQGEDGYWEGSETGYFDLDGNMHAMSLMTGHEAYEGLFAIIRQTTWADPERADEAVLDGLIFEGEVPPMPDPVVPLAE